MAPDQAPRLGRILVIGVIGAAIVAGAGTMLLLGLPGALFMELLNPMFKALGRDVLRDVGDGAWPLAIGVSLLWPWPLPLGAVAFAAWRRGAGPALAYFAGLGVAVLFGLVITTVMMALQ
jgi:hypothetical protein